MSAAEEKLPTGSFIVLRAEDGLRRRDASASPSYSVVLLHGWLQSFDALLELGQHLRDTRCVDVLLLDFYAHGRSPCLPSVRMHTVLALVAQVRRVIETIEWQDRGLVIGGVSMGASVTLHYSSMYPDHILGLLLLAPSGMPEVQVISSFATNFAARVARAGISEEDIPPQLRDGDNDTSKGNPAIDSFPDKSTSVAGHGFIYKHTKRLLSKCNLVKRTPEYLVDSAIWALVSERCWPMTVVVGTYDVIHTPHIQDWKGVAPWARLIELPMTHWWLCSHLGGLKLEYDCLWDDVLAVEGDPCGVRPHPTVSREGARGICVDRARL